MKKWIIGNPDIKASLNITQKGSLPKICSDILVSRGIDTIEKAQDFFNFTSDGNEFSLSDPFLIKDMAKASEYILNAIEDGKQICIYGDYDCDGITSTAVLYSYIDCMGGNVSYHINMRSDGYGMCESVVRKLADEGVELIITVDNGISAINEAKLAAELGMELVITDHHQPGEILPEAIAIVNPHRTDCLSPYKDLCGCGVVLKLIAAMDGGDYSSVMEQFSDLAAIATIADVVPISGENREIVKHGLHYLENTENIGLKALIECAGVKSRLNSTTVAFMLAPRLNASGRFGSASDAARLLLCEDYDEAILLAKEIDLLNNQRKSTENEIMTEIESVICLNPNLLNNPVLVLFGKNWHHGVIGIIAARLAERFGKPVFIMSDDGDEARGSARSVEGFCIYQALTSVSKVLTKFGGHSGAGGFSLPISKIDEFNSLLQKHANNTYITMPQYSLHADKMLLPEEINIENIKAISILEPFGEGNKQPIFAMIKTRITDIIPLSDGSHTKLKISYGIHTIFGLLFGVKTSEFSFKAGDLLDMLVYPEINEYNGNTSINVRIIDYRKNGIAQQKYFAAKTAYEQYVLYNKAEPKLIPRIVPTREELITIYKSVPKTHFISCDAVYSGLNHDEINYCKFKLALDIFEELNLFEINRFHDIVKLSDVQKKVSLENSNILKKLNQLLSSGSVVV